LPGYNPEKYYEVGDINLFRNSIVDEPYEAASVCKTFTFAAARGKRSSRLGLPITAFSTFS